MAFGVNKKILLALFTAASLVLPLAALAQDCTQGYSGETLCNALGGVGDYKVLIQRIFAFIGTIIGTAAIAMMVYSGARMITANGNPDTIKTAKSGFVWSILGFVLAITAYVIVVAVENFIGVTNTVNENTREIDLLNPFTYSSLQGFISTVLNGFAAIVGILAVLMIIINGFRYLTAGGNEDQAEQAKSGLLWSVVGLAGIALAYVIIAAVTNLLS